MLNYLFGDLFHDDKLLTAFQIVARAFLVAAIALICVRITGRRAYGMRTPFDNVITFLLGATLSRAIVGDGSFVGVVAGSVALACLHRGFAYISSRNDGFRNFVNGKSQVLFDQGSTQESNLKTSLVSPQELEGVVRKEVHLDSMAQVEKITMEPNGELSVVTTRGGNDAVGRTNYSLPKRV